ncbi:hypothetical protein PGDDIFCJ_00174 [Thermus phage YS40_Isch]|nr:hypothetical protein PGDDIFCJ_00174 [Thermus phage YS40_Isch]
MFIWEKFAKIFSRFLGGKRIIKMTFEDEKIEVILVEKLIPNWAWAQTWGRVILVKKFVYPNYLNSVLKHEVVHVRQWKKYGLFFPLIYLWASFKALLRGEDQYHGNEFEKEAYNRN